MSSTKEPPPSIPSEVSVKRSDAIYNAHAYLTKVPVSAIEPFIEAFSAPGDVVLDMYAGSGMTGVAAATLGRRAELRDISALGRHIGSNYVNLVEPDALRTAANAALERAQRRLAGVYSTACAQCDCDARLSRTVWSYVYECRGCGSELNYYETYRAAEWRKSKMSCVACSARFVTRGARRLAEVPVLDTVACGCSARLAEQAHAPPRLSIDLAEFDYPSAEIGQERQMYQASALARHSLQTTASFFSARNLAALTVLREEILATTAEEVRHKLMFIFTAILTRASKRYQWHPKRPLNAANQNYYIAPVFYEWNVFDLFARKVEAASRADALIREKMVQAGIDALPPVHYRLGSADALDLENESVDYAFTDPPFGSNIFYSDMTLFQEAWLGTFTDHEAEAVVDRSRSNGASERSAQRYERLITDSLKEAHRVLKPNGYLSLVFSNSSGRMWALVQRAIDASGFLLEHVAVLSKGQRSVKGLASGFENVVVVDLIMSMRKAEPLELERAIEPPPDGALEIAIHEVLVEDPAPTPSHVYLGVIRDYLSRGWDVSELNIAAIGTALEGRGYDVDAASGRLTQEAGRQHAA